MKKYLHLVFCFLCILITLCSGTVRAQGKEPEAKPLVTDRPDVAESAVVVGPGRFQIEAGAAFMEQSGEPGSLTTPTLLRFGLSKRWEFRLESDIVTFLSPGEGGFSDVSVGTKVNLVEGESSALGILVNVNVPSGFRRIRGTVDPAVKILWDQDLGEGWGLGFNAGAVLTEDHTNTRFIQPVFALAVGKELTKSFRVYGEVFGEGPPEVGSSYQLGADTGLTYLVNNDLQVDLSVATGLSPNTPDWALGVGVSARY
jgi:hypothetical protein